MQTTELVLAGLVGLVALVLLYVVRVLWLFWRAIEDVEIREEVLEFATYVPPDQREESNGPETGGPSLRS